MDILHLRKEEIEQMSSEEIFDAMCYCTATYTVRRVDYTLVQLFSDQNENKKKGILRNRSNKPTTIYTFENKLVDNFIARETIKDFENKKDIPKGFYLYKKGEEK